MREGQHGGHEEWCKICYTIVFSQCKNQENVIQLKTYNKNKYTIDCIAEQ